MTERKDLFPLRLGEYRHTDIIEVLLPKRKNWQSVKIVNRLSSTEGTSALIVVNEKNEKYVITDNKRVRLPKDNV